MVYMLIRIIIVAAAALGFGISTQVPKPEPVVAPEFQKPQIDPAPKVTIIPNTMVWPVAPSEITSYFGDRPQLGYHYGIDFGGTWGVSIPSVTDGTVIFAGWNYGNEIRIQGTDGYTYLYGHLNSIHVSVGQTVSMGQEIGLMGSTGYSTGPHLHLEVWDNGVPFDPLPMLQDRTQTKKIVE
jgi:murein DD-endopeptidase MepM/ murein hydrolase activator NlpD